MLTEEMLRQHNMGTLDSYKERHGDSKKTEITFYQTFLGQSDYVISKISEYQYLGKPLDEGYTAVLQCREECREQIRLLEGDAENE